MNEKTAGKTFIFLAEHYAEKLHLIVIVLSCPVTTALGCFPFSPKRLVHRLCYLC